MRGAPSPTAIPISDGASAASQRSAPPARDEALWTELQGGGFTLVDQTGTTRTLSEFRGRLVVLYLGYTTCPGVCSPDLWQIGQVVGGLGVDGAKVQPLFITIDPERDTPQQLRAYLAAFDPRIVGLTGTNDEIGRVADRYRAYFAKVPVEGSAQQHMRVALGAAWTQGRGLCLRQGEKKLAARFTLAEKGFPRLCGAIAAG